MLMVATWPVLMYYSDIVLQDDGGAPAIWDITFTGDAEIALPRFSTAARHGQWLSLVPIPEWGKRPKCPYPIGFRP